MPALIAGIFFVNGTPLGCTTVLEAKAVVLFLFYVFHFSMSVSFPVHFNLLFTIRASLPGILKENPSILENAMEKKTRLLPYC